MNSFLISIWQTAYRKHGPDTLSRSLFKNKKIPLINKCNTILNIGNMSYSFGKFVNFLSLKWCHLCKEHAIVGREQSWVMHVGCAHWQLARCSLPKPNNFFLFCFCHWLSWLLSVMPESRRTRAWHKDSFSCISTETMQHLVTADKMDFTCDHHLSNRHHRPKLCKNFIKNAWSWAL